MKKPKRIEWNHCLFPSWLNSKKISIIFNYTSKTKSSRIVKNRMWSLKRLQIEATKFSISTQQLSTITLKVPLVLLNINSHNRSAPSKTTVTKNLKNFPFKQVNSNKSTKDSSLKTSTLFKRTMIISKYVKHSKSKTLISPNNIKKTYRNYNRLNPFTKLEWGNYYLIISRIPLNDPSFLHSIFY